MRKSFTFLLSFIMLFSIAGSAFAQEGQAVRLMGFELQDNNRLWSENRFFERMEQRTGIRFEYHQYGELTAYLAAVNALQKDQEDLPEALLKARLDPVLAQELYDRGVLIDLAPLLDEHMPNLSALMAQDPSIRSAITLQSGIIPALPFIAQSPGQNILWINKDWLATLRLEMPANAKELEAVLSAFLKDDPNRNGRKDEVPLSFIGPYDLKFLAHAFGMAANDFNVYLVAGQVQFLPFHENFEAFVTWLAGMYKDGLLDKSGFSTIDTLRRVTDAKGINKFGAFFSPLPTGVVPVEWTSQYQALLPLEYEGKSVYRMVSGPVHYGAFALTTACRDVPAMLKWVDYLYSLEGSVLASIGQEGTDYVVDGDGSWRLLSEAGDTSYFSRAIISSDYSMPGIASDEYQMNYHDPVVRSLTEQTRAVAERSVLPYPDIPLTREQVERILPLQNQLGRYVDESIARFVLGEWDTGREQFDTFKQELENLGAQEFLDIWQNLLTRR